MNEKTFDKDCWLTAEAAVNLILPYVKDFSTIWCPFDTKDSNFVKTFTNNNINCINSHICDDKDFFNYEPDISYDVIVSNPPFSKLDRVIKRLYDLNKPYAILCPVYALQGNTKFKYIKDTAQILIPENRIYYLNPITRQPIKDVSFGSVYLCNSILPERLIYKEFIM